MGVHDKDVTALTYKSVYMHRVLVDIAKRLLEDFTCFAGNHHESIGLKD